MRKYSRAFFPNSECFKVFSCHMIPHGHNVDFIDGSTSQRLLQNVSCETGRAMLLKDCPAQKCNDEFHFSQSVQRTVLDERLIVMKELHLQGCQIYLCLRHCKSRFYNVHLRILYNSLLSLACNLSTSSYIPAVLHSHRSLPSSFPTSTLGRSLYAMRINCPHVAPVTFRLQKKIASTKLVSKTNCPKWIQQKHGKRCVWGTSIKYWTRTIRH